MFDLLSSDYGKKALRANRDDVSRSTRASVEIELSKYVFERLSEDREFTLYRGRRDSDLSTILAVAPTAEYLTPESLERLKHAYALRHELDPGWAARPQALVHHDGRASLLIEDPGGEPLDRLVGQPMELGRFLHFALGLATALGGLHERGLVHKDIKPANILVDSATGHVWLTGFCIASPLRCQRQAPAPPELIAGTLAYMAPDQTGRMNRSIDFQSDLYSVGVTLYEVITGVLPFKAADPLEWIHCHIARRLVPPEERAKDVPGPISAVIMKLLAKTAEERYQTAVGLKADFRRCLTEWESHGRIDPFPLGTHDASDRLLHEERTSFSSMTTLGTPVAPLDLGTVVKASQAMSSETVPDKLIEALMRFAVEHASAERGLLIVLRGNEPYIEAEAKTDHGKVEVAFRRSAVTSSDLPESVLHYVLRTLESVILDDALVKNLFSEDQYVRQTCPRSVLCLPLLKQAKLVAVLYLENSLASHLFTGRLTVLELLASQAAISLDNARLYADLQVAGIFEFHSLADSIAALTQENSDRKRAEEALRASEGRLQDIVDNTSAVIVVKDLELRYTLVNREHERRYHVRRDQIHGKTDFDIHPSDVAEAVRANDRQVIKAGVAIQFEETVPAPEGERHYVVVKFLLRDRAGDPYAVCGIATDITALRRAEEMQAALAREREMLARQRAAELAKANEALRACLDALASVPELDEFLGQVMLAIARQLSAVSSTFSVINRERNTMQVEFVYQEGRVLSPSEAQFPEVLRELPLDGQPFPRCLSAPIAIWHILDPSSPAPEPLQFYLREQGIKTLFVMALILGDQPEGWLCFHFTEERDFRPEEIEIARALATQASLAIQITRLAKAARQSAVLAERNALAGEIHDSLAQLFTGITMQLGAARFAISTEDNNGLGFIERATELAQFGLAEARRSAFSLQPTFIEDTGLIEALQTLVERSNIPGRLRCNFHLNGIPDHSLPPVVQLDLLRIAQEAISNAVRHAKPTVINVNLLWGEANLVLEITDNGSGIADPRLASRDSFGLTNMRARAAKIGAQFDIQTGTGCGTSIAVRLATK